MKLDEIKSPSNDEFREQQQKQSSQKLSIQSFKNLQEEIKRGSNLQPINNGKLSRIHEESPNSSTEDQFFSENEENYLPVDRNNQRRDQGDKKKQRVFQGSIVVLENYAADNKNLLKDSTQMWLNQKRQTIQDDSQSIQTVSEKCFTDGSSACESHISFNSPKFSCTDLLEKTDSNKFFLNDQMSNDIISSTIDENDLIQIDTLREYYMENDDQLEHLRRQQTADFQFNNLNEDNYDIQNPYLDDKTLLAVEKIGTLSPSKIMNEIRQINLDLNLKNENIDAFYENDSKTQIYMLKLQMKARMEDGLIQQRLELKTILNQYLQFIDKLMKDKKNLSETLQFSQTENVELRNHLQQLMSKYDDTESQLKQIFIAHKQQTEQSKREVELKEKKIQQITDQMVLQEQGVKNIKQKYESEYEDLVQQNKEIMKQIMELNSENEYLQQENESLQQKKIDIEKKLLILEEDLQEQKQNSQILAQKNTQIEENDKQNMKIISNTHDILNKIKIQLDNLISDQDEENKEQLILSDRDKQKYNKNQNLNEERQNIIQQSNACIVKIEVIQQKITNMKLQNNNLQKINQEFGIKLQDNENMFQQLVEQQNKQYSTLITNLKNDIINNKQVISNLQQSLDLQVKQSNNISSTNVQLQQEITFLKTQITELQTESQEDNNKIQEKEMIISQLENSVLKYKDQINKNLTMIDDIFSSFKQKENAYNSEISEKSSEIKYLKNIISKYEQGVQKYYSQNELIQLQQIDLLRSYLINHETVRSSKSFIDQQQQSQVQSKLDLSINEQSCQLRCQTPQMIDSVIDQRESKSITPAKTQYQSQIDSLKSTQNIESKESLQNIISSSFFKKTSQSAEDCLKSQDINRNIQIIDRSESPVCINNIESQRYNKNELTKSIDIDKSSIKQVNDKDDYLNQLLKVMNNLKIMQEGEK